MKLIEDLQGKCDNGMELNIMAHFFNSDNGYYLYKVQDNWPAILAYCKDVDDTHALHKIFYALIYAVILKFPAETIDKIKKALNVRYDIEDSEIKQIIGLILKDKQLMARLEEVAKEVQARIDSE